MSSRPRASASGVPGFASKSLRSIISECRVVGKSSARPISPEAQIMPKLITPRSFAGLISTGSPSPCHFTHAPGFATATSCAGARFTPPQTIVEGAGSPTSTVQTRSLSASGCGSTVRMRPTTSPARLSARLTASSTSTVDIVKSYESLAIVRSAGRSAYFFIQFNDNFITSPSYLNCFRKRRSALWKRRTSSTP